MVFKPMILALLLFLAGCQTRHCSCTGQIPSMGDSKILADDICRAINKDVAKGLTYQVETFQYLASKGGLGVFFRLTSPQADPAYGAA